MAFWSLIHFASDEERSVREVTLGVWAFSEAMVTALTRVTSGDGAWCGGGLWKRRLNGGEVVALLVA